MTEPEATVFVSYQHTDKPLARAIRAGLDAEGFRVWIDEGELKIGDSLFDSIADALDRVDFVLALMSATSVASDWCQKEISLAMTGEVSRHGVTVMPLRVGNVPVPATLKGKLYLDVDPDDVASAVAKIAQDMRRHLSPPRPLPPRKRAPTKRPAAVGRRVPHGPLRMVEVDRYAITTPLGDGSRGSRLYAVPIRLSETPDATWAELFVRNWDHPPSFTTMHRPGIARVAGDRIVLDGTTVEEVARVHQTTLRLAVDKTNAEHADHVRRDQTAQATNDNATRRHEEEIERGLTLLRFNDDAPEPEEDLRTLILRQVQRAEQDADFGGVLGLDQISQAVGHPRHLVKAELTRLLDDRLIRIHGKPVEDLGGGYDLIQPTLTSQGVQALREA